MCASVLLFSQKLQAQLKANFTTYLDSGCTQLNDTFTNTSSGGALPYSYYWSLGNTIHATTKNFSGIFKTPGIINIKLKVTDANGKSDSITKSIKVKGSPIADHSTSLSNCSVVHFLASEDSLSATAIDSFLFVGDGSPGFGPLYFYGQTGLHSYTYTRGGNYHYIVTITGSNGCKTTYKDSVHVPLLPTIFLPPDTSVCQNSLITISEKTINGTKPYRIWWGSIFSHLNDTFITRRIKTDTAIGVHVMDANGCTNNDSIYITVFNLPDPEWKANYFGNTVVFHAIDSALPSTTYKWNFGDGDSTNGHSPSHLFPKNTTYSVSLKIIDTNECTNQHDSSLNITKSGIDLYKTDIINLSINPNPFASQFNIQYNLPRNSNIEMALCDLTGKEIALILNENQAFGNHQTEINTDNYHLAPGMYILKFKTDYSYESKMIVRY